MLSAVNDSARKSGDKSIQQRKLRLLPDASSSNASAQLEASSTVVTVSTVESSKERLLANRIPAVDEPMLAVSDHAGIRTSSPVTWKCARPADISVSIHYGTSTPIASPACFIIRRVARDDIAIIFCCRDVGQLTGALRSTDEL